MPHGKPLVPTVGNLSRSAAIMASFTYLQVPDRPGIVSHQQGTAAGLGSRHVQRSDKFGGGFFVNVEGLHHLHCLVCDGNRQPPALPKPTDRCYLTSPKNLVRKGLYYNVQYYKDIGTHAFLNDEHILRLHISML